MKDYDVVIVGGSVAGSSLAGRLADGRRRILLVDRAVFPRDKVCGEGLMPAGVKAIADLGLLDRVEEEGASRFYGVQFLNEENRSLQLDFRELDPDHFGLIVSRKGFDNLLWEWAGSRPGVDALQRTEFVDCRIERGSAQVGLQGAENPEISCRLLVGADGIRSSLHRPMGVKRVIPRPKRYALRAFYNGCPGEVPFVTVHSSPIGEAYVAPFPNGLRVSLLLFDSERKPREGKSLAQTFSDCLSHFRRLEETVREMTIEGPVQAAAPLGLRLNRICDDRILLIGDAAGAVDPVTGQGISIALKDACEAGEFLEGLLDGDRLDSEALSRFKARREVYFAAAFDGAQRWIELLHAGRPAGRAFRALRSSPLLRSKFLKLATTFEPIQIGFWDRIRLTGAFFPRRSRSSRRGTPRVDARKTGRGRRRSVGAG